MISLQGRLIKPKGSTITSVIFSFLLRLPGFVPGLQPPLAASPMVGKVLSIHGAASACCLLSFRLKARRPIKGRALACLSLMMALMALALRLSLRFCRSGRGQVQIYMQVAFLFSLCTLRMCKHCVCRLGKGKVLLVGCSLILILDIKTASIIHSCCLSPYGLHEMPQFHVYRPLEYFLDFGHCDITKG